MKQETYFAIIAAGNTASQASIDLIGSKKEDQLERWLRISALWEQIEFTFYDIGRK